MARTAITKTTLYGTPSQNIFETIDTRTNVGDPRDPADQIIRVFVYHSEPKSKAMDFSLYPYIIAEDATMEPPTLQRADHKTEYLRWKHTITIRTAKRGAGGNRDDTGITDMRNIVNELLSTFKSETIKAELRAYYMWDIQINVADIGSVVVDQQTIHETIVELSYSAHFQVST